MYHVDLHSFPTRRSSDLSKRWRKTDYKYRIQICRAAAAKIADRKFELAAWISYENGKNRYEAIADVDEAIDFIRRSEEHTSELQSRLHLVCRLLLEKKQR